MKWLVLLPVTVEADPADFATAGQLGMEAIGEFFTEEREMKVHLLMQDGSDEVEMLKAILAGTLSAKAAVSID